MHKPQPLQRPKPEPLFSQLISFDESNLNDASPICIAL